MPHTSKSVYAPHINIRLCDINCGKYDEILFPPSKDAIEKMRCDRTHRARCAFKKSLTNFRFADLDLDRLRTHCDLTDNPIHTDLLNITIQMRI